MVIAQYYMFVSLGRRRVPRGARGPSDVAQYIARAVADMGPYRLLTDGSDLPVFAFTLAPEVSNYTVFDVSARLRQMGWLVPAYRFPENRTDLSVLRVVVRAGFTHDMAELFVGDLRKQTAELEALKTPLPDCDPAECEAFSH